jgi:hypothetical protein
MTQTAAKIADFSVRHATTRAPVPRTTTSDGLMPRAPRADADSMSLTQTTPDPIRTGARLERPRATTGCGAGSPPDHKKIAIMYGTTAMFFFVVGGIEALFDPLQLARPTARALGRAYNESSRCTARRWCSSWDAARRRVRQLLPAVDDRRT